MLFVFLKCDRCTVLWWFNDIESFQSCLGIDIFYFFDEGCFLW